VATNFRELIVWQKAMALVESVYPIAAALPDSERFGLASQLRRSAVSIPSNIAEGHERRSRAEYRRFIAIACGSLAELETQLELAQRLFKMDARAMAVASASADEVGRLLRAIERSLREVEVRETPADYGVAMQPSALSPQPYP
jgi:four helix bundle protein